MKYCFILFLGFVPALLQAQAPSEPLPARNAVPAKEITTADAGPAAAQQVRTWQLQVSRQPADATAWLNYYLWTSRDKTVNDKEQLLAGIITNAGQHIRGRPEYDLMRYLQSGKKDSASLYRVMNSGMDKSISYPYLVQFFTERGDDAAVNNYCLELEALKPLPRDQYEYHYNVLMSAGPGATVYAKGIYDLVPLCILQQVYGVRPDIRLRTYAGPVIGDTMAYLCLTLGRDILAGYPDAVYTGLLVQLSGTSPGDLEKHVEQDFDLSQLNGPEVLSPDAVLLYRNYLPALVLLYEHYKKTGSDRVQAGRDRLIRVARKTGLQQQIDQLTKE
ncbi:MAG: hypothetical protein ABW019_17240 [Chitinophagaceae bacterium]